MNPFRELAAVWRLARIYRAEQPDLVHHFTVKPIIYGTLAARSPAGLQASARPGRDKFDRRRPCIINTLSGLGFLFSDQRMARMLRVVLLPALRYCLRSRNAWTVVLNPDDELACVRLELCDAGRLTTMRSDMGVDVSAFSPDGWSGRADGSRAATVLMACRLLWDKGVAEFVEAARLLRRAGLAADFWLAGAPDPGNPRCVPQKVVEEWAREGVIRWLGHRDDMPELLRQADIAVLPSYHEGLPRFLLEAAATGLPLVATDIPGCRPIVKDGENGFLVPVRDAAALAASVARLVRDPLLRERMGEASRELAEREFADSVVLEQWVNLYQRVLARDSVPA
jgi:glycosyltransferase involved in cell wall biosynthesis